MLVALSRRLAMAVPALLGASLVVFLVLNVLPGDPLLGILPADATQAERDELSRQLGLSDPVPARYAHWLGRVVQGDLGYSLTRRRPVVELLRNALSNTAILAAGAAAIGMTVGLALGAAGALRPNGAVDRLIGLQALLGLSVPAYWLALLLIVLFSVTLKWLPASGMTGSDGDFVDLLRHLVMPALATSAVTIGLTARMTRASLVDTFGEDFVLALRARGLSNASIFRHVAKNAAPPILTVVGLQVGYLLGGSVLVETIFSWPGLGQLLVQSIAARDMPVIQASVLTIALMFVLANLVIDLIHPLVNPRLRRAHQGG